MANYTNTMPDTLLAGDKLTFSKSGTYQVPRRVSVRVTVIGAQGANGGNVVDNVYGKGTAAGGAGGPGGKVVFEDVFETGATLALVVGTRPANAASKNTDMGDSEAYGTYTYGNAGASGGESSLTKSSILIAVAKGGGGGAGGRVRKEYSGVSLINGGTGTAGGVTVSPADATISTGTPAGITIEVLSANEPPTAPGSIYYDTPKAGKEIDIELTPATDPD